MGLAKKSLKEISVILGVVAAFIALGYFLSLVIGFEDLRGLLEDLKEYGPFIVIPITIVEVVIAPIPGGLLPVVLGAIYGPALGVLYAWIGNVVGSMIAFWLAKKFGKFFIAKLMPKMNLDAFEQFVAKRSITIWLMYVIPIFPIDVMSFALGLSKTSYKKFFTLVTVAYIPHLLILTYLGDIFTKATTPYKILIGAVVLVILVAGYVIERRINAHHRVAPAE